jgi:hypothetical protein
MKYKLDDSVLHRIVQIVQEAFLTGVDCADIMRQIELEHKGGIAMGPAKLTLTEEYKELVKRQHEEMLKFAEEQSKKKSEEPLNRGFGAFDPNSMKS